METLICPHCSDEFLTDKAIAYQDSKSIICRTCKQKYQLGTARRLGAATMPDVTTVEPPLPKLADAPQFRCKYCKGIVDKDASKCPYCQEWLREDMRPRTVPLAAAPVQNNGAAAVMSLLIPGLGQIYKGQILNGFAWFFVVLVGYAMFIFPGLILHVACVYGASRPK